jgi:hypothetical protein
MNDLIRRTRHPCLALKLNEREASALVTPGHLIRHKEHPMLATLKRVRVLSQRVQLIASSAVLLLLFLLSSLVLASRPHVGGTASSLSEVSSSIQSSTRPDLRDEHPQRQWLERQQSHCVPMATSGRGHVPATGASSC